MSEALDSDEGLFDGLISGKRRALARAMTLVESSHPRDRPRALGILKRLSSKTSKNGYCLRLGVTGPPGVGKSTFIEGIGQEALSRDMRLCVLPVDPSSPISGGSLLGDRTRMENLSRSQNCFIRPSPSSRDGGGVSGGTREILRLCELVGFDLVIVETVGVGQGETDICSMVDSTILLYPPHGGDELQGLKKGILEVADFYFVNKADMVPDAAARMQTDLRSAFSVLPSFRQKNQESIISGSAKDSEGLALFLDLVLNDLKIKKASGEFLKRRKVQELSAFEEGLRVRILERELSKKTFAARKGKMETKIQDGEISVMDALDYLFSAKS